MAGESFSRWDYVRVAPYSQSPSGKKLRNKFIVYDARTMKPLSGIAGQSKSDAERIARQIRAKNRGKLVKRLGGGRWKVMYMGKAYTRKVKREVTTIDNRCHIVTFAKIEGKDIMLKKEGCG